MLNRIKIGLVLPGLIFVMISCGKNESQTDNRQTDELLIAYNVLVDEENDNYDVFITNLEGDEHKNITNNPDVAWTYTAGKGKVFFISDRDTCKRCGYYLYEMKPDGSGIRKIADISLRDSWMSTRNDDSEIIIHPHASVDSAFYIINLEGKLLHRLPVQLPYTSNPSFSPDGTKIAFNGANKKSKRDAGFDDEIYLMNDDGSGRVKLTTFPQEDTIRPWYAYKAGPPIWHPTGDFISYQSYQNGMYRLFAVSPDGQKNWQLLDLEHNVGFHNWSSDGKWLTLGITDSTESKFNVGLINWETKAFKILTDSSYKYQQAPVFLVNE